MPEQERRTCQRQLRTSASNLNKYIAAVQMFTAAQKYTVLTENKLVRETAGNDLTNSCYYKRLCNSGCVMCMCTCVTPVLVLLTTGCFQTRVQWDMRPISASLEGDHSRVRGYSGLQDGLCVPVVSPRLLRLPR